MRLDQLEIASCMCVWVGGWIRAYVHVCMCVYEGELVDSCCLLVPATCECISGMDLLRQFYMLPR